jgi:hypothetical protein
MWSKRAFLQLTLVWQSSQRFDEGTWRAFFLLRAKRPAPP